MASIRKEVVVQASPGQAWDAVSDVGRVHQRLVPGVLVDTRLEPGARIVSFANGLVVRELIVSVDPAARRLVWAAVQGRLSHHNASLQVLDEGGGRSRLVWIADLLPDELAGTIEGLMDQGIRAMQRALDGAPA